MVGSAPNEPGVREAPAGAPSDEPSSRDPLIGCVLHDTYRVTRKIASGGMSHIYEAVHLRLPGRLFAVKVLLSEMSDSPELVSRFEREIAAIARIDHPQVVRFHDFGLSSRGRPFMVAERLHGLDLAEWLRKYGPMPLETVLHVGQCMAQGLAATHARGVIHRDLKPSNVFLVGDFSERVPTRPEVKILDFGLSRLVDTDDGLTQTRLIMGTPGYMSPEQAGGGRGDRLSDVYGLGAVLFAASTGEAPFSGDSPQQTVLAVLHQKPPRPRTLQPQLPEGLEVVIQCCMARKPSQRYRSVDDVWRSLANLAGRPTHRETAVEAQPEPGISLRWQLLFVLPACFAWFAALVVASASSLPLWQWRIELTPAVAAGSSLLGALLVGSLATLLLHVRRELWHDSARLRIWLGAARPGLVASVGGYAVGVILTPLLLWLMPHVASARLPQSTAVAWPGHQALAALLAVLWGGLFAWRGKSQTDPTLTSASPRFIVPTVALASVVAAGLGTAHYGRSASLATRGTGRLGPAGASRSSAPPPASKSTAGSVAVPISDLADRPRPAGSSAADAGADAPNAAAQAGEAAVPEPLADAAPPEIIDFDEPLDGGSR